MLTHTQKQLIKANDDLDKLIGVRTRQIKSSLRKVTEMPESEVRLYIPISEDDAYTGASAYDDDKGGSPDDNDN